MKIKSLLLVLLALFVSFGRSGTAQDDVDPDEVQASLSKLGTYDFVPTYRVNDYISAAIKLQKLGQKQACEVMHAFSVKDMFETPKTQSVIYFLCRMLFVKKTKGEFRQPMAGQVVLFTTSLPNDPQGNLEWPLAPIEIVDGVPFCIAAGYNLGGLAEGSGYLNYCMKNCSTVRTIGQEGLRRAITSCSN